MTIRSLSLWTGQGLAPMRDQCVAVQVGKAHSSKTKRTSCQITRMQRLGSASSEKNVQQGVEAPARGLSTNRWYAVDGPGLGGRTTRAGPGGFCFSTRSGHAARGPFPERTSRTHSSSAASDLPSPPFAPSQVAGRMFQSRTEEEEDTN